MLITIVTQSATEKVVINTVEQQLSESYISFSTDRQVIRAGNALHNETVRVEQDTIELNTPHDYCIVVDRWRDLPPLDNWYGASSWFNQRQAMFKLDNAIVTIDSEKRKVTIYTNRAAVVTIDGEQQYGSYTTYFTQYSNQVAA